MTSKKLKNLISLDCSVKIYVPGTIDINQATNNSFFVDKTLNFLSAIFNGSTSYDALGCWNSPGSGLIKEHIVICVSYCKSGPLEQNIEKIINFCLDLKKDLNQESISLEINNILYFI